MKHFNSEMKFCDYVDKYRREHPKHEVRVETFSNIATRHGKAWDNDSGEKIATFNKDSQ